MASLPAGTSTSSSADLIGLALRSKRVEYYLPFMIGVWLDAICLGLLLVAFGAWVSSVRKTDTPLVRYLVLYLMVASFMMSGFMMGQWFLIYVHGYGDFFQLFDTHLLRVVPTFFVVTRVPAASFFAMRAWNLLKRPVWLPLVLAPFFLACLVSGLVGTAFFTTIPARKLVLNCILIYSSTEVVSDIIVTGSIYYGLSRSKTGWTNTDQVITRLMKIMVETQTPPSILSIAFLVVSLYKGDGTAIAYFVFMPKVHVLCMLLGVNSRVSIARELNISSGPYSPRRTSRSGPSRRGSRNDEAAVAKSSAPFADLENVEAGHPNAASTANLITIAAKA